MGKQPWKAPDTDQIVEETPSAKIIAWTPPETDPIVKKKDEPVSPEDSSSASAEPVKPSKKSFLSVNDPFGIGETILKQLESGFGDQVPKATAQAKEVATSAFQDANMDEYIKRKKSIDFQKYAREKEGLKWHQAFDMDTMLPKYKEQFIKDRGLEKTVANIAARQPEIIARRKETEDYVQQQNKESAKTLEGIPQSYQDVKDIAGGVKFVTNLATQGLWQIPLVVATKGLSGVAMEAAEVYDQQLDQLAKKHRITRQEVIDRNLDKPAEGQLYAVAAASLDRASAGGLVDIIKKGGAPVLKKALAVTTETLTEPAQGILEEVGGAKGAGLDQTKAFKDAVTVNVSKRINEALGGMFGSGVITALSPSETVATQQTKVKDSGDLGNAAEVADKIQSATDQSDNQAMSFAAFDKMTDRFLRKRFQSDNPEARSETELHHQTRSENILEEGVIAIPKGNKNRDAHSLTGSPDDVAFFSELKNWGENMGYPIKAQVIFDKEKLINEHGLEKGPAFDIEREYQVKNDIPISKENGLKKIVLYTTNSFLGARSELKKQPGYETTELEKMKDATMETLRNEDEQNRPALREQAQKYADKYGVPVELKSISKDIGIPETINPKQNDSINQSREVISSEERIGQEPVQEGTLEGGSGEKIGTGGILEKQEKTQITNGEATNATGGISEVPTTNQTTETIPTANVNENTAQSEVHNPDTSPVSVGKDERQHAILARIEDSNADPAIKRGIKARGDTYIPKGLDLSEREADDLLDLYGDKADGVVRDLTNGITPDARTVMSAKLYQKYSKEGNVPAAVDIAMWQAEQSTLAGRAGNAAKMWKLIVQGGEEAVVLSIERQHSKEVGKVTEPVRKELNQAREQIEAEIKAQIEQKVQEGIKERIGRANLISKEKKKEISDFFDKFKGDVPKGLMMSSPAPAFVLAWNGAVEVMKQAVLTGASVANAVQAGIDYLKSKTDQAFDEDVLRAHVIPQLEKLVPVEKIDPDKVDVPKLTGRKKKEFIEEVVKAHNEGKLTDKKFDDLYAKKLGVKELSTEDRTRIRELAKTIAEAEKFEEQLKKDFTPENIKKHKEFVKLAKKANQQLQEFATAPNNVWDTLGSILQGNLMSTMSLVSNVFYNTGFQPVRFLEGGMANAIDFSLSKLAKLGLVGKSLEDRTINWVAIQEGYFKGLWNGTMEGLKQLKTGPDVDERNLREIQSNFSPLRARERAGGWMNLLFPKGTERTTAQKINDFVEGTIGWEADMVFRFLNSGDLPFRMAAQGGRGTELAALKGLKGKEKEQFLYLPDQESAEDIKQTGQEATFQQSDEITLPNGMKISPQKGISKAINNLPGPLKLIMKSQIPFVKTPTNIIYRTLAYAGGPLSVLTGVYKIAKGDKRGGSYLMARGIMGQMIIEVGSEFFLQGLMTGDDDREEKKRQFQLSKTPPPNSIDISAIGRMVTGEDKSLKDGDIWVSYSKLAVVGVLFDYVSNSLKSKIQEDGSADMEWGERITDLLKTAPKVFSSTLDQSYLQGVSTLIEALRAGEGPFMERWLTKTLESLGSIIVPNTVATLSKASDEYVRDTKDEDFWLNLRNIAKTKVFMGSDLPPKVNLWGEKVTGNPDDRSKLIYYLFDPSKFKGVDTNDYRYQLYQSYKTDYDGDWLPSMPQRKLKVDGQEKKLTPTEYELFATYVGQERARQTSGYINSPTWEKDSPDKKKEELKYLYGIGLSEGKKEFLMNTGLNVKKDFSVPLDIKMMKHKLNKLKQNLH